MHDAKGNVLIGVPTLSHGQATRASNASRRSRSNYFDVVLTKMVAVQILLLRAFEPHGTAERRLLFQRLHASRRKSRAVHWPHRPRLVSSPAKKHYVTGTRANQFQHNNKRTVCGQDREIYTVSARLDVRYLIAALQICRHFAKSVNVRVVKLLL